MESCDRQINAGGRGLFGPSAGGMLEVGKNSNFNEVI